VITLHRILTVLNLLNTIWSTPKAIYIPTATIVAIDVKIKAKKTINIPSINPTISFGSKKIVEQIIAPLKSKKKRIIRNTATRMHKDPAVILKILENSIIDSPYFLI
jgi:hypothetical protein